MAILVIAIGVFANTGKTIDLNKYVSFEEVGYNGCGEGKFYFDTNTLYKKYASKIKFTSKGKEKYGTSKKAFDVLLEALIVNFYKNGEPDPNINSCTNGDVITLKWEINEELMSYINCKLKYSDMEYTISKLKDIDTFDAFTGVELNYAGMSPHGILELKYNGSDLTTSDFIVDKTINLKNGDIVTISLKNDLTYYANSLGKMPEAVSKEYTVEGLEEYILSVDKITDGFKNQLKTEVESTINAYATEYYSDPFIENLEYAGYIFGVNTNTENADYYNRLYVIYKADISCTNGKFSTTKIYYPVEYRNVINNNGESYYEKNVGIIGSEFLGPNANYSTKGYLNPFELYLDIKNKTRGYNLTAGDGFEVYCKYESIKTLSDIPEDYKERRYSEIKTVIEKYIDSTYSSKWNVPDLQYLGEYLLVSKEQEEGLPNNKHIIVFSGTITNISGTGESATIYYPVVYESLIKLGTGECMYQSGGEWDDILGKSRLSDKTYTRGYLDTSLMYADIIAANKAEYTYDISEGLIIFGN